MKLTTIFRLGNGIILLEIPLLYEAVLDSIVILQSKGTDLDLPVTIVGQEEDVIRFDSIKRVLIVESL